MQEHAGITSDQLADALEITQRLASANPRAQKCGRLLGLLSQSGHISVAAAAEGSCCGRTFAFEVLAAVRLGNLKSFLDRPHHRSRRLSPGLLNELKRCLGKSLKTGKEAQALCEERLGGDIPLPTVYRWCHEAGFSFSKQANRQSAVPKHLANRTTLTLDPEKIAALKVRQSAERVQWRVPDGSYRSSPRDQCPVLRIEAVLRCASEGAVISHIAKDLGVARKDVRRWVEYYKKGGIEKLCERNVGGRPANPTKNLR